MFRFQITGYYGDSPLEEGGFAGEKTIMDATCDLDHTGRLKFLASEMAWHIADRELARVDLEWEQERAQAYAGILHGILYLDYNHTRYGHDHTSDNAFVTRYRVYDESDWDDLSTR